MSSRTLGTSTVLIREIVQQALTSGFLTIEAENLLRELLTTKYDSEDLNAFMLLQKAAMKGHVQQESRKLYPLSTSSSFLETSIS